MIVCLCHNVTEKDIIKAFKKDSLTLAGTSCGSCRRQVEEIIRNMRPKSLAEAFKDAVKRDKKYFRD